MLCERERGQTDRQIGELIFCKMLYRSVSVLWHTPAGSVDEREPFHIPPSHSAHTAPGASSYTHTHFSSSGQSLGQRLRSSCLIFYLLLGRRGLLSSFLRRPLLQDQSHRITQTESHTHTDWFITSCSLTRSYEAVCSPSLVYRTTESFWSRFLQALGFCLAVMSPSVVEQCYCELHAEECCGHMSHAALFTVMYV